MWRGFLDVPSVLDAVIYEGDEAGGDEDVCYVRDCVDDGLVGDQEMARRDPASSPFIRVDLVWAPRLGRDVRHRQAMSIPDQVVRNRGEVLVEDPLPRVGVSPPLEAVLRAVLALMPGHVYAGVVAELELDGVGRHEG